MRFSFISLWVLIMLAACNRKNEAIEEESTSPCGKPVLVNTAGYDVATTLDGVTDVSISGDCLTVKAKTDCCTDFSEGDVLYGEASLATVYPPEHRLKIVLNDKGATQGACGGICTQSYSFDLTPLKQEGTSKISLRITGAPNYSKTVEYSY